MAFQSITLLSSSNSCCCSSVAPIRSSCRAGPSPMAATSSSACVLSGGRDGLRSIAAGGESLSSSSTSIVKISISSRTRSRRRTPSFAVRAGIRAVETYDASFQLQPENTRRPTVITAASRQQYNVPQQSETIPLWLWICLASYRAVKDSLQFLWEQPGQLKDIEWPAFQSTIRMAVLTVVVVALLIIFLATIDSTFSYVLASILRRVP